MPTIIRHDDKMRMKHATIAVHRDDQPKRAAITKFKVSGRRTSSAVSSIEEHEKIKGVKLIESENQKQLSRWIDSHLNIDPKRI